MDNVSPSGLNNETLLQIVKLHLITTDHLPLPKCLQFFHVVLYKRIEFLSKAISAIFKAVDREAVSNKLISFLVVLVII